MITILFWPAIAAAGGDWLATWRGWDRVRIGTKPVTLMLMLAWFTQVGRWEGPLVWFGLGLAASLLGDILLLNPDRFFLGGLTAFLSAHIFYIIGFNQAVPTFQPFILLVVGVIIGVTVFLFRSILRGVTAKAETRAMKIPVLVYGSVLTLMLISAVMCFGRGGWSLAAAGLVSLGAGLFLASDSLLAANRFVGPLRHGDLKVMITYHLAQIAITAGVLLAFR